MRVCFWGPPARRIFGVFDEPAMGGSSDVGVVLCYPHGRDYLTAFRSFRILATRFGRAGFHVLRFDYLGTGDSSGDVEDASIPQWIGDIVTAVNELRRSHELRAVSLVGLRLGATLAALAAAECQCVERLVLWEPVIDGRDYVTTQRALHRAWIDEEARDGRKAPSTEEDLLGCRFTKRLCCDIEDVNLESLAKVPAPSVLVMSQKPSHEYERLTEQLREKGARVKLECVEGPTVWSQSTSMNESQVPNGVLQAIVTWVGSPSR